MIIFGGIIGGCLLVVIILGIFVLRAQERIDKPVKGILLVDRQDEDKPLVYFEAAEDPRTFRNGEILKLQVRVITGSQRKHHS